MRQLQHQFQVCHMTVFRALKKSGYHTSYNHNAGYYTLAGLPQFDDWGLWAYRDVRFSRAGTLLETLVALVTQATAGLTIGGNRRRELLPARGCPQSLKLRMCRGLAPAELARWSADCALRRKSQRLPLPAELARWKQ